MKAIVRAPALSVFVFLRRDFFVKICRERMDDEGGKTFVNPITEQVVSVLSSGLQSYFFISGAQRKINCHAVPNGFPAIRKDNGGEPSVNCQAAGGERPSAASLHRLAGRPWRGTRNTTTESYGEGKICINPLFETREETG